MIDRLDLTPSIFTPLTLGVVRVYSGFPVSGEITAFAETGKIGPDEDFSCGFGRPGSLQIRDGPDVVSIGATYVAFFDKELTTGQDEGPLTMPTIEDLFVVRGAKVVGLDGRLEPEPVSSSGGVAGES